MLGANSKTHHVQKWTKAIQRQSGARPTSQGRAYCSTEAAHEWSGGYANHHLSLSHRVVVGPSLNGDVTFSDWVRKDYSNGNNKIHTPKRVTILRLGSAMLSLRTWSEGGWGTRFRLRVWTICPWWKIQSCFWELSTDMWRHRWCICFFSSCLTVCSLQSKYLRYQTRYIAFARQHPQ